MVNWPAASGNSNAALARKVRSMDSSLIFTTCSICTGVGRYALRKAVDYARERRVWDVPIGAHQGVAHPLALAHIHMQAALLMCEKACAAYDAGREDGEAANMAKFLGAAASAGLYLYTRAVLLMRIPEAQQVRSLIMGRLGRA